MPPSIALLLFHATLDCPIITTPDCGSLTSRSRSMESDYFDFQTCGRAPQGARPLKVSRDSFNVHDSDPVPSLLDHNFTQKLSD